MDAAKYFRHLSDNALTVVEKFDLFRTPRPKKFFVLQITYVTRFDNCRTGLVLIFFGQFAH